MEGEIGISAYLTSRPGIGGRLKATPEDFVVVEVPLELPPSEEGHYQLVKVTSRNWETNRLVRELSRALGVSRRRISFAGTKDKRAITTQWMTFRDVEAQSLSRVRLKDVSLEPVGRTAKRLELGHLLGNEFSVRVTEVSLSREEVSARMEELARDLIRAGGFPNFFGPQRFGEVRPISHLVGRAIVRGDFQGAVNTYLAHPQPGEDEDAFLARRDFEESGNVARALRDYPKRLSFERAILNHLRTNPGDYDDALAQLPFNLLTLLVYAYQSFLFNRILSLRLQEGLSLREPLVGDLVLPMDKRGLPRRDSPVEVTEANKSKVRVQVEAGKAWISGLILGYEVSFAHGEMGRLERSVVEEEGADPKDFLLSRIPRLSSRGLRRELLAPLIDFSYELDGDVLLRFRLNPGCYATALLREIMKTEDSPY